MQFQDQLNQDVYLSSQVLREFDHLYFAEIELFFYSAKEINKNIN